MEEGAAAPAPEAAELDTKVTLVKRAVVPKQTTEVTPEIMSTEPAAEVVIEGISAAVGRTQAVPKLGAAKDATTVLSGSMAETLIDAVRRMRLVEPDLGIKRMVAKLQEQHTGLGAGIPPVTGA